MFQARTMLPCTYKQTLPATFSRTITAYLTCVVAAVVMQAFGLQPVAASEKKPNLIFIMADDQGYGDLSCFGAPKIKTPHIDTMAKEGMRFTSFYSQPVCGPTRTALHTGCYPMRVAEYGNIKSAFPYVHDQEILLAKQLQEAGYKTGWVGKVDITDRGHGFKPALNPVRRGYDFWYGVIGANGGGKVSGLHRNETLLAKTDSNTATLTQRYTKEAIDFVERNKEHPFMLYVAHTMPHFKIARSKEFEGVSEGGIYGDVIEELDWSTGQIVAKLKELGLDKNTLVIYTSDNGPGGRKSFKDENGSPGPLRGCKGTTWEGGTRVPCVMWGPGLVPAGTSTDEVSTVMDIFPTFISLAGGKLPEDRKIDGKDLTPLLTGKEGAKSPHRYIAYYQECDLDAVRSGRWKLVFPRDEMRKRKWLVRSRTYTRFVAGSYVSVEKLSLFDLEADIGESKNVAAQNPEVVARLQAYADEILVDLGNYKQIGKGVRFFEDGPKWPNLAKWRLEKNDTATK